MLQQWRNQLQRQQQHHQRDVSEVGTVRQAGYGSTYSWCRYHSHTCGIENTGKCFCCWKCFISPPFTPRLLFCKMPRKVDVFLLPCSLLFPLFFLFFNRFLYMKKVQLWEWVNWIQILDPHFASSLSKRPLVIRTAHLCGTVPDDEKSVVKKT